MKNSETRVIIRTLIEYLKEIFGISSISWRSLLTWSNLFTNEVVFKLTFSSKTNNSRILFLFPIKK